MSECPGLSEVSEVESKRHSGHKSNRYITNRVRSPHLKTNTSAQIVRGIFQQICLLREMPASLRCHCFNQRLWLTVVLFERPSRWRKQPQLILFVSVTPFKWKLTAANPSAGTKKPPDSLYYSETVAVVTPLKRGIWRYKQLIITCDFMLFFSFCEKDALQGVGQGLAQGAASVNYRPMPLSKKTCCWLWCGLCAIPVFHKHLVQNDVRHFRQQLLVFSRWTLDHCEWVWMGMINCWIYYWRETLCYNLSL